MKSKKMLATVLVSTFVFSVVFTGCGASKKTAKAKKQDLTKSVVEVVKAKHPEKLPETAKKRKDTLVIGVASIGGKYNPIYTDSAEDQRATALVFDSLVSNDEKGNPIPALAEKWEVSKDGKSITYHIKKGVKYTNGEEVKAKDIALFHTMCCDSSYDGAMTNSVQDLVGYDEYHKGQAKEVKGIKVKDDYTITYTVKNPMANIVFNFGGVALCSSYYGKDYKQGDLSTIKKSLMTKPMGSGPYKMTKYVAGQEVDFDANENYYAGEPKIKHIILKLTNKDTMIAELKSGNVDVNSVPAKPKNISMLDEAGFLNKQFFPENSYGYIGLNLRKDFFKDKKVRQALTYGLNRKGFVDSYYKQYGDVCNQPQSPISFAYNPKVNKYPYDPDKANKMLDEAGWKKGSDGIRVKDGKKFEVHWLTYTGSKYEDTLVAILKENWKKLGVSVIVDQMEFSSLAAKVYDKQDFDMYNMAWQLSIDPDATQIFDSSQDVLGGSNAVGFKNEENDKLLKQGREEVDKNKRTEIYHKWDVLINEELPYIFLSQSKSLWAVSSRVKGMKLSPYRDWTYDINKVTLE